MNEIREKPKTYKIGYRAKRKNAVRHLALSFEAFSPEEAKLKYSELVYNMNKSYVYTLYTGDWKEVP
jgi:hypothetical protein